MEAKIGGQVHGISLPSMLQMYEMEKTTCTLKITSNNNLGYLYLFKGELIDAEAGDLKKEKAAFEIISWEDSSIEIEEKISRTEKKINMPLMSILMEGLKIKDEKTANTKSRNVPPKKKPKSPPPPAPKELKRKAVSPKDVSDEGPEEELSLQMDEEFSFDVPIRPPVDTAEALSHEVPLKPPEEIGKKAKTGKPMEKPLQDAVSLGISFQDTRDTTNGQSLSDDEIRPEKASTGKPSYGLKGKNRMRKGTAIAVSALLLLIVVIAWMKAVSPLRQKREFDKIMSEAKSQSQYEEQENLLKEFLETHSNHLYIDKIKKRLKEVQTLMDDHDFETALQSVSALPVDNNFRTEATAIYRKYISKHPDGVHVADIKQKINQIPEVIDEYDFQALKAIGEFEYEKRIGGYGAYLSFHPQGKYVQEVTAMISDMGDVYYNYLKKEASECDKEQKWDRCISLCDTYIENYKGTEAAKNVKWLRSSMAGERDFTALESKANAKGTDYAAARQIYLEYIKKEPGTSAADKINQEINKLDAKIKEKETWEALAAFCKNRENDVFDRIDKLDRYVEGNPNSPYLQNSKSIMKQLQKEKYDLLVYLQKLEEERKNEELRRLTARKEKERIQREKDKVASQMKNIDRRYTIGGDGVITDTQTGLMWCMLDSYAELGHCMNYIEAKKYVEALETGGYTDWRLPNSNDLLVIYLNKPFFPGSNAEWYWTSEQFWKGAHELVKTVVQEDNTISWKRNDAEVEDCGSVRAVRP